MGVRGRKPKPTMLKLIEGNPGHRPIAADEVSPGKLGDPPSDLCAAALEKWREMVSPAIWGLMATGADRDQLAEYCRLSVRKAEAEGQVAEHGAVVASPNGFPVQSPWLQILNKCRAEMLNIATEFGGTPSSRTRVKVNASEDTHDEFFDD
jgi:P27 family predicted phage terminase small subunit